MSVDAHPAARWNGFRFSTDGLAPTDAFEMYHAIFAVGAEAVPHGTGFRAELAGSEFARMVVHRRRLASIRHVRAAPLVRRNGFSHFTLTLCLAGSVTCVGEDSCRMLQPGEIALQDMTRPGSIQIERAETITAAVAREVVEAVGGDARHLHGRVIARDAADPLRRYMLALTEDGPDPDLGGVLPEEEVAHRLREALTPETTNAAAMRAQRLLVAHRIIEAQIGDPAFGVGALADALRVSRATLYRLFEPLGGVTRHLLDRRLTRLRRLASEPGQTDAVSTLVARAGLVSDSHASRVFLQRFGERPGGFRLRMATMTDTDHAALAMKMWQDVLR